jgi:hypothetical protein
MASHNGGDARMSFQQRKRCLRNRVVVQRLKEVLDSGSLGAERADLGGLVISNESLR